MQVSEYRIRVVENRPAGTALMHLSASDRDAGRNAAVQYRLMTGERDFRLDSSTGLLTSSRPFNREVKPVLRARVEATDGGSPALTGAVDIVVFIDDENDEVRKITSRSVRIYTPLLVLKSLNFYKISR